MKFHANITYFDYYVWFIILKFIILVSFSHCETMWMAYPKEFIIGELPRNESNDSPTGL